ncbi:MAG: 2-oxoisovalerate dehydrogenase E2 component (dihydrolipoyl transacylase) [Candidatus Aldehydirespiratoraceae bacterium]|jgi:2-oxoisovalerate dehydrogenase E2 component (dihydrolipoyl transacylase)
MSVYGVKLPDVGEGVAEAELVEWLVEVGDHVDEETPLAEVLTDKATVEISSPVNGLVTFLSGNPGDLIAVGTEFVGIEIEGSDEQTIEDEDEAIFASAPPKASASRPTAAPAVRNRARTLGIDLGTVTGTGPDGRIVHADLDRRIVSEQAGVHSRASAEAGGGVHIESIRGLRRRIAERLSQASIEIPHITYVDEVDATELEKVRSSLNRRALPDAPRLTLLPFVVRSLAIACSEQSRLNAHYNAGDQELSIFDDLNVGIATQTPDGLLVPVVRSAERLALTEIASEIARLAAAARDGTATRDELSGSTITITSLGAMGGLMTTPIINRPEVAIIGINKMEIRPMWSDGAFVPRSMFNLSCSFDHRIVDGWDAAIFVQRLKELLEVPALLFADDGS